MKVKIGIYCPKIQIGFYNTDYKINKELEKLQMFTEVDSEIISSFIYTLSYNFDKIITRLFKTKKTFVVNRVKQNASFNIVYQYGEPKNSISFFNFFRKYPIFLTIGFRTDEQIISTYGYLINRQEEADNIVKQYSKAKILHFHSETGRIEFLKYRPDYIDKTITIPFFLPKLANYKSVILKKSIKTKILFVGYDGKRKGLYEFIETINQIDTNLLIEHNVEVNIVSKDKPINLKYKNYNWWKKLPNNKVKDLMSDANIFVLVPHFESYGLVLIEAMANSCAIITDNNPVRLEITNNSAICIEPNNIKELKENLIKLILDKALAQLMGEKAFGNFMNRFSPEVVGNLYKKSFQSLLSEK